MTVTATSQADPTKTDQATVTVVDSASELIVGTYTYMLSGFNSAGGVTAVGSISFQSGGTFIAGEDSELSSGASNSGTWSGTYTVGNDGRGTVTGSGLGIGNRALQISVMPSDEIRFIQLNTTGQRASGVMRRANATALSLAGDWALETSGADATGGPLGLIGHLQFDGSGNIIGSFMLEEWQTYSQGQLTGNYTLTPGGRFNVQLLGLGRTLNWVLYSVSDNELFLIMSGSQDPLITQLSGRLVRRTGSPLSAGSLDGAAVLSLKGGLVTSVGQFVFDGAISAPGTLDVAPYIGNLTQGAPATVNYAVDPDGCGPVTISFPGDAPNFNLCIAEPNQAFVLQTASPNGPNAYIGEIHPQIGPFNNAMVDGTYYFGSDFPVNHSDGLLTGVLVSSGGTLSGTADISLPSGDTVAQTLSGSILSFDPVTGRGTASLNVAGLASAVFYMESSGRMVMLPAGQVLPGTDRVGSAITLDR